MTEKSLIEQIREEVENLTPEELAYFREAAKRNRKAPADPNAALMFITLAEQEEGKGEEE